MGGGGAIVDRNYTLEAEKYFFRNNTFLDSSVSLGGAFWLVNCTLQITDSRFIQNQARYGGAVAAVDESKITIRNSSCDSNAASVYAQASYSYILQ